MLVVKDIQGVLAMNASCKRNIEILVINAGFKSLQRIWQSVLVVKDYREFGNQCWLYKITEDLAINSTKTKYPGL